MKTPEEARAELTAALRSGAYLQGVGQLRDGRERYCCLGVGCEISGLGKWVPSNATGYAWEYEVTNANGSCERARNVFPEAVMKYFGFATIGGSYGESLRAGSLWQDNDSHGKNFNQIADIIESAPEGLLGKIW